MMMSPTLFIFVIIISALPIFSSAAAAANSNQTFKCYSYAKNFTDLNLINPPAEGTEDKQCDQCFGYVCYSKGEYILGYGCRDDFFKSCEVTAYAQSHILKEKNETAFRRTANTIFDICVANYCSHQRMVQLINNYAKKKPTFKIGPKYVVANITFTQLTTPAPIRTTTQSAFNPDNGNGNGNGNNGDSQNDSNSTTSKMISLIFIGIFIFVVFFM